MTLFKRELDCLVAIAKDLGDYQVSHLGKSTWTQKPIEHDPDAIGDPMKKSIESSVDRYCSQRGREIFRHFFSQGRDLGEEDSRNLTYILQGKQETDLIFDGLDGSANHTRGIRKFGFAGSIRRSGKTVAAVLYEPNEKVMFAATSDSAVYCSKQPTVPVVVPQNELGDGATVQLSGNVRKQVVERMRSAFPNMEFVYDSQKATIHRVMDVLSGAARAFLACKGSIYCLGPGGFLVERAKGVFADINYLPPRWELRPRSQAPERLGLPSFGILGPAPAVAQLAEMLKSIEAEKL